MTRRIKRSDQVEFSMTIKEDGFIRPPRETQRNWLLNGAMSEFMANLEALDVLARRFVPGVVAHHAADRTQAILSDQQIMEDWQIPLMQAMADVATHSHGDVLEVGFGRGVSAAMIQDRAVRSHTIIECNDDIVVRFRAMANHVPRARHSNGTWFVATSTATTGRIRRGLLSHLSA